MKQVNSDTELTYDADQIVLKSGIQSGYKVIINLNKKFTMKRLFPKLTNLQCMSLCGNV